MKAHLFLLPMSLSSRRLLYEASLCLGLIAGYPLAHAAAATEPVAEFNLESQSLDSALASFSRLTGVQMLYDSSLVAGRQSQSVIGRLPVRTALLNMLKGTGLRARFTAGGSVVITESKVPDLTLDTLHVQAKPVIGHPGLDPRFASYVALVQQDIIAAIHGDPSVASGSYRISVRIWLDSAGRITQSECIKTSGSSERDQAFIDVLERLQISQEPPVNLPQPVRIEFFVR